MRSHECWSVRGGVDWGGLVLVLMVGVVMGGVGWSCGGVCRNMKKDIHTHAHFHVHTYTYYTHTTTTHILHVQGEKHTPTQYSNTHTHTHKNSLLCSDVSTHKHSQTQTTHRPNGSPSSTSVPALYIIKSTGCFSHACCTVCSNFCTPCR